jgi:hypothetical protein
MRGNGSKVRGIILMMTYRGSKVSGTNSYRARRRRSPARVGVGASRYFGKGLM